MAYNWIEFLTFAENLMASHENPGPHEAAMRSSVSRAYYAAFRTALEIGKQNGYSSNRYGDHSNIRDYFINIKPVTREALDISAKLQRLHELRCKADYDNELGQEPKDMAIFAISIAKKIFADIDILKK